MTQLFRLIFVFEVGAYTSTSAAPPPTIGLTPPLFSLPLLAPSPPTKGRLDPRPRPPWLPVALRQDREQMRLATEADADRCQQTSWNVEVLPRSYLVAR